MPVAPGNSTLEAHRPVRHLLHDSLTVVDFQEYHGHAFAEVRSLRLPRLTTAELSELTDSVLVAFRSASTAGTRTAERRRVPVRF
ncbi:hypothetical protein PsYK624_066860 [Phanerochaete sordida]|uniref:Uncharacterized protein n=1 Tax=Phanerochaete sordida TaxID=48140 RepID=A0A9P3G9Q9_9APHY|nr:hypothetical protein PsYK624_066860 [Phanerochaete sordida]